MDKTAVFRAYVKTIKTRNRAFGSPALPQTDILRQRKPHRDDFSRRAKDIVNDLAKLTDFLNRHFNDYIDIQSLGQHATLTDAERDKIDVGAQHIIKTSGQQVNALKKSLGNDCGGQIADHRRQVVRYVEWRLKSVSKLFAEIKATRSQRSAEYENVSKLSNLTHGFKSEPINTAAVEYEEVVDRQYAAQMEDELSPEELQMFEAENIEMYNELNQLSNEVCSSRNRNYSNRGFAPVYGSKTKCAVMKR